MSASFFGLLYLLLIPTYAALYSVLPHQFYHTTVAYEATLRYDGDRIAEELREAIVAELRAVYGGGAIGEHGPTVDLSSIDIFETRVERGTLMFAVMYQAKLTERTQDREISVTHADFVEVFVGNATGPHQPDGRRQFWVFSHKEPQNDTRAVQFQALFPRQPGFGAPTFFRSEGDKEYGFLVMPKHLQRQVTEYIAASKGFPSGTTGSFFRMFYFSAITITTVGYGDIVPVTPLARTLVASEAIFGVVVAGLFLNALAQELIRQRKAPKS